MLPVSSAYLELRIWASKPVACRPAHASLSAARASSGRSANSLADEVSPSARATKNRSATGSGPSGRGVHALSAATVATADISAIARVTDEINVAIETNVKK